MIKDDTTLPSTVFTYGLVFDPNTTLRASDNALNKVPVTNPFSPFSGVVLIFFSPMILYTTKPNQLEFFHHQR